MKYYLDTEFIEYPHTIELISLGLKCEDGRKLYCVNKFADLNKANDWVKKNVLMSMPEYDVASNKFSDENAVAFADEQVRKGDMKLKYCFTSSTNLIGQDVIIFITEGGEKPEFWGYYADYDWVVFCWLFGTMMDLPKGWPMYCRDLKQLSDEQQAPHFEEPKDEHNALVDAEWNEKLHEFILSRKWLQE